MSGFASRSTAWGPMTLKLPYAPGKGPGEPAFIVIEMITLFPDKGTVIGAQLLLQQRILRPEAVTNPGNSLIPDVFLLVTKA